jgi:hypothetical protein
MNSLQRYYLNNFQDADRQEGVDLLIGFQQFTELSNDTSSLRPVYSPGSDFFHRGMSIQEAAHRALLGNYDVDSDDSDHVPIKLQRRTSDHFGLSSSHGHRAPGLDLRWLPGDLQTQMRGILSPNIRNTSPLILQSLDVRAAMELPWWVTSGACSDDEETALKSQELADAEVSAINNAGYLAGAVLAGAQSPLAMASFVLALLVASLPSASSDGERE